MCLLIGAPGVGKTLMLKRLHSCSNRGHYTDIGEAPATISTVGTNLTNVVTGRKTEVTVRELGGCMAPIWHNYYSDCHALMYMVDMSNRLQISASCVLLLEMLISSRLQKAPILLILNKVDIPGAMKRVELESVLRMDDIRSNARQTITVLEASAKDGQGLQQVAQWIQEHGRPGSS